jgi:malate dehydrogenase
MKEVEAPLVVCLTGAAGQIAYALIPSLLDGSVFSHRPIELRLLDISAMMTVLNGVIMEIDDSAYPNLHLVMATSEAEDAFKDCDIAILVGAMPRREGMERKDLLRANAGIFQNQGATLNRVAKPTVKVLVVGNPANTNALIASHYAPSIPKTNFSALTRLDENRALSLLAQRLSISITKVKDVIIWGNHSNTQYPDISHIRLNGKEIDARESVDREWYESTFVRTIQTRGASVIAARKLSSAMSAAKAISDHLRTWLNGTADYHSMAVISSGEYGLPRDIFYSFPITVKEGQWKIVEGLQLDQYSRMMMEKTAAELVAERDEAFQFLK